MEGRKRKSALENYIDSLQDPPEKQRKTNEFYNSLRLFYKRRWNAPMKLPNVQGVEVNLHRLYDTVMALGGWQKVALGEKWADIADMLGVRDDVVCGDHAIKLIYMRYLSKYEQVETMGDVDDYMDGEMSRARGRTSSFFATNDCPISSGRIHEFIKRDEKGNPCTDPDYSRLVKSLLSGLPNEINFALNVCMLLSNAGPRQLRIAHAPSLLTILVAHVGIFDEDEECLSDLAPVWRESTKHDFNAFWAASGVPADMLLKFVGTNVANQPIDEDEEFFTGIVKEFNVKDPVSWRLNQVATIIRNLTFEPVNRVEIAESWPIMKFLLLCSSCRYSPLFTAAYDALGNLACDIDLSSRMHVHVSEHALLRTVKSGIFSSDKFKLIRALEILTGLCSHEGNESAICDFLSKDIVEHILNVIGVKDIMMCVYTLECLYQISEMGDLACQSLAECPRAISQLVSMATLEAVSFGPAGLAGMKVVEYAPQYAPPPQQQHPPQHVQPRAPQQMTVRQAVVSGMGHHMTPATALPPHMQQHVPGRHPQSPSIHNPVGAPLPVAPLPSSGGDTQVEQLTDRWIRANCIFDPQMSTPRGELYAAYVDDLRNQYHSLSGSLAMFSGVMKALYPEVQFRMAENGIMIVAQGIRLVRPHHGQAKCATGLAPAASAQAALPPGQHKTSTPASSSTVDRLDSANINSHPLMKQMLAKGGTPNGPTVTNGVNGHKTIENSPPLKTEQPVENGASCKSADTESANETTKKSGQLEVCQEPISAASLFGDNDADVGEVRIERREQKMQKSECGDEKTEDEAQIECTNANENGGVKIDLEKKVIKDDDENLKITNGINGGGEMETPKKKTGKLVLPSTPPGATTLGAVVGLKPGKKMTTASKAAAVVAAARENGIHVDLPLPNSSNGTPKEDEKVQVAPVTPVATTSSAPPTDYMCEWDGCGEYLPNASIVLLHLSQSHVIDNVLQVCKWPGCDGTPRSRWSLVTHLQDHHCSEQSLKMSAQKRRDGLAPARPIAYRADVPREVPNHPGYSKNAAIDAIRRHAFNFLPREITDEPEGPVTKSIRLTSCLILRNLARYSSEGRHLLRRYEQHLCWLALSRLESSHALAQLLAELHAPQSPDRALVASASSSSLCGSTSQATPSQPATPSSSVSQHSQPVGTSHRSLVFNTPSTPTTTMPPPALPYVRHHVPLPQSSTLSTPLRAGAGR